MAPSLSKDRLPRLREAMVAHVAAGEMPGVVALVSRGSEVHVETVGALSFGGVPMKRDTIFRIASMTKPVIAVATLMLVEECKLRLDDPVDDFLPELANRKVLKSLDGPVEDTVPSAHAVCAIAFGARSRARSCFWQWLHPAVPFMHGTSCEPTKHSSTPPSSAPLPSSTRRSRRPSVTTCLAARR